DRFAVAVLHHRAAARPARPTVAVDGAAALPLALTDPLDVPGRRRGGAGAGLAPAPGVVAADLARRVAGRDQPAAALDVRARGRGAAACLDRAAAAPGGRAHGGLLPAAAGDGAGRAGAAPAVRGGAAGGRVAGAGGRGQRAAAGAGPGGPRLGPGAAPGLGVGGATGERAAPRAPVARLAGGGRLAGVRARGHRAVAGPAPAGGGVPAGRGRGLAALRRALGGRLDRALAGLGPAPGPAERDAVVADHLVGLVVGGGGVARGEGPAAPAGRGRPLLADLHAVDDVVARDLLQLLGLRLDRGALLLGRVGVGVVQLLLTGHHAVDQLAVGRADLLRRRVRLLLERLLFLDLHVVGGLRHLARADLLAGRLHLVRGLLDLQPG